MSITPPGGSPPSPPGMQAPQDDYESWNIWYGLDDMARNGPCSSLAGYLRDYLYSHGMQGAPRAQVEAYIDSVLESKDAAAAGQGDVYMRFNISNPLDLYNPQNPQAESFDEKMAEYTDPSQGYDGWTPSKDGAYPSFVSADTWYFNVVNQTVPSELQPFKTALENELKSLQSQAVSSGIPLTTAEVEQGITTLLFSKDFFSYGVTSSSDLFSFLSNLGWPVSAATQQIFTTYFLPNQSWITQTGPGAKLVSDYLAELQTICTTGGGATALQTWFENITYKSSSGGMDFFTRYPGITLQDFESLQSCCAFTPPDVNLANAYFNFGTLLEKRDADASFYQAFFNETVTLWNTNPSFTALQDFGEKYITAAFLDSQGNLPTYSEAAVNNMEASLNVGSTGHFTKPDQALQDALFQLYAFMKERDPSSQDYQLGLKLVQFAFLGQSAPSGWTAAWPSGNISTLNAFMNNWFNPPAGSTVLADPYLMFPGAKASDIEGLFTSMGLTLTYSTPSLIDQECETAWAYLQNTILPGPGAGSDDAKLFNAFIAAYQAAGSQQATGKAPASLLTWVNSILMNDFQSYPKILQATKNEFYSEVQVFDPEAALFQDRNYIQDVWLPAHPNPNFQDFGENLRDKMNDYLRNPPPGESFQTYLSSIFFVDIPGAHPGMQFSDVTALISNFKSFSLYPTYNAWIAACTDKDSFSDPAGQSLFQTLMDQFNMPRGKYPNITYWRDDPSIQTDIVPKWMQGVAAGTTTWQDTHGNTYSWSNLSAAEQSAFNAIMNS